MHSQESPSAGEQKFKTGVIDFIAGSLGDYLLSFIVTLIYGSL